MMTQSSIINSFNFDKYHIPNQYVQWYELEPTFGVYPTPNPSPPSSGKWSFLSENEQLQQDGDQKKKKIR